VHDTHAGPHVDDRGQRGIVAAREHVDVMALVGQAARDMRDRGMPALLVCSGSEEQEALADLADVVVDGPAGVLGLLDRFAAQAG